MHVQLSVRQSVCNKTTTVLIRTTIARQRDCIRKEESGNGGRRDERERQEEEEEKEKVLVL